ncbi:hypothetical protein F0562_019653 [Nyssa sinensis]|uniref:Uncharacterized protein n=1 Tax=Nyssa sinensis TaxID=561372 RepID=A0A5J5BT82_9ASTE|nr:hypothetical protein F0562_019653 [Nyssa sinensis]
MGKAVVSEIERPWEVVMKARCYFFVSADEPLKVLVDGFQQPCGTGIAVASCCEQLGIAVASCCEQLANDF